MSWFRRRSRTASADDGPADAAAKATDASTDRSTDTATEGATEGATDAGAATGADAATGTGTDAAAAAGDVTAAGEGAPDPAPDRSAGPFDAAEVGDDVQRIDLGALRVPAAAGAELRLEVEEKTQRVVSATVVLGGSTLQLQAFAAPRTEGVWREIRSEIAAQVARQGGSAEETTGPFGRELLARLPARTADGRTGHRPARFVGVDGPRWFLRGVVSGSAAVQPEAAAPLEAVLRGTVVVRGAEAMAPRDLLALTLPPDATRTSRGPGGTVPGETGTGDDAGTETGTGDETGTETGDEAGRAPERPRLAPPERGPEITERR